MARTDEPAAISCETTWRPTLPVAPITRIGFMDLHTNLSTPILADAKRRAAVLGLWLTGERRAIGYDEAA